jgi:hypothetical protein
VFSIWLQISIKLGRTVFKILIFKLFKAIISNTQYIRSNEWKKMNWRGCERKQPWSYCPDICLDEMPETLARSGDVPARFKPDTSKIQVRSVASQLSRSLQYVQCVMQKVIGHLLGNGYVNTFPSVTRIGVHFYTIDLFTGELEAFPWQCVHKQRVAKDTRRRVEPLKKVIFARKVIKRELIREFKWVEIRTREDWIRAKEE